MYHSHPNDSRVNGNHSDSNSNGTSHPHYSSHSNGGVRDDNMQSYSQSHYQSGPPVQHHQQYTNQLPPIQAGMSYGSMPVQPVPGTSNVPQNLVYNPVSQHLAPGQSVQQHNEQISHSLSAGSNNGKYQFQLMCVQQPQRARMCGYGDKDRRPITPPPCLKLVITDMAGNPVPASKIDGQHFVLNVDLWDGDAQQEVSIVRSSSSSPAVSISTATTTSYPPVNDRPAPQDPYQLVYGPDGQVYSRPVPGNYPPTGMIGYPGSNYPSVYGAGPGAPSHYAMQNPHHGNNASNYQRNLIGSLSVNASILKDTRDEESWWFVLQDLSVRMEGWFRLRLCFYDLASATDSDGLNKDRAPLLSYCFTEKFQVYSAKKFPGVIESTDLSKAFSKQGIKIPIRKDNKMEEVGADED